MQRGLSAQGARYARPRTELQPLPRSSTEQGLRRVMRKHGWSDKDISGTAGFPHRRPAHPPSS